MITPDTFLVYISLSIAIILLLIARFHFDTKSNNIELIDTSKITNSFNSSIKKITEIKINNIINKIVAAASIYHKANNIMLTSNWFSDLDNNINLELKLFQDDLYEYKLVYTDYSNHVKTLLLNGKNNTCDLIDANNYNTIITHLEYICDDIKSKAINSFSLNIKPHALVYFRSRSFALASYPSHKHNFKAIPNSEFEGKFLLDNIFTIEEVIAIFPDADLVTIYDQQSSDYKSFNIDDISKIFLF